MSAVSAFFASLLAAWPAPASDPASVHPTSSTSVMVEGQADAGSVWQKLAGGYAAPEASQVRIEQHIIWRISPLPGPTREAMTAIAPTTPVPPRLVERRMGDCVQMSAIAGGQPQGGSRLLLFLRDRRLVAANLEKACSARDFYRGFYVDKPNADGKLCADRDRILSRSGARCEISSFRLLVADD